MKRDADGHSIEAEPSTPPGLTRSPEPRSAAAPQPPRAPKARTLLTTSERAIEAVVRGDCSDPFAILGWHRDGPNGEVTLRAFLPGARSMVAIDRGDGSVICTLEQVHPAGLWAATLPNPQATIAYRLRAKMPGGLFEFEDAYRFPPILGDLDVHLLAEGTHLENYERLGAHGRTIDGVEGTAFAVWAPNARRVSVVGDFCSWDGRRLPMRRRHECGVWELFVPHVGIGDNYKYEIKGLHGELLPLKADPYGLSAERAPHTASKVADLNGIEWRDGSWMENRRAANRRDVPISIYEVHLGSWRRAPDSGHRYLTYRELAEQLVPYATSMGFTHLELMPVSEHPFDGSWGYQPIGLYAPTNRHGSPEEFAGFVDACHRAGLGVLIDWVPGHFPTDPHGLEYFDGTHLYEHADRRQGFHQEWNTLIYNYGRREVVNFLLGNALFWLDRYHIDGLRVDAVASMLYLDYSRREGEWIPNVYGGRENLEAIAFIKRLNELVAERHPGALTVAEESTAWPGVSRPIRDGGLGFGFKWNMGWMHDTLGYISRDPIHRKWHHHELTFGLIYAFSEDFVLPLSHDEVVHGKGSLLAKMPGDAWQQFANLRAYFGFMFGHPGKKLLFMGGEFAQGREWSHDHSLDWHLLDYPQHQGIQNLIRDLNRAYREIGALHERDCDGNGFHWVVIDDDSQSVYVFLRFGHDPARPALVACNFTPQPHQGYRVGVPLPGYWREIVNTDAQAYGGSNVGNSGGVWSDDMPRHGRAHSLSLTLPPLATIILEHHPG